MLSAALFVPAIIILIIAKSTDRIQYPVGDTLHQTKTIAIFALAMIAIYLHIRNKNFLVGLITGCSTPISQHYSCAVLGSTAHGMNPTAICFRILLPYDHLYAWFTVRRAKITRGALHKRA